MPRDYSNVEFIVPEEYERKATETERMIVYYLCFFGGILLGSLGGLAGGKVMVVEEKRKHDEELNTVVRAMSRAVNDKR